MARAVEESSRQRAAPWGILTGVALAAAVVVIAVSRRRGRLDADSVIDACDRAADRLERLILGHRARAS